MKALASFYHTFKFWMVISVLSLVLGVAALILAAVRRNGDGPHRIASLWSRLLCRLNGIPVEIIGLENVQRDRAQIFVANHQGYFDIFALSGYLPVQIRWMAKASLFRIPFVGWSMKAAGYIPVQRDNKKKAFQSFLDTIEKIKAGCSVVLFPEGTRSENGIIGPFKKGGHLLAARSGAPMVPVTILGTGAIIRKGSAVIRPGAVRIIISPPVDMERCGPDGVEQALVGIRETIIRNYEENRLGKSAGFLEARE